MKWWDITVFPYKDCFNTITNIISLDEELSSDVNVAKMQILNAIKNGNNIIANRAILNEIPELSFGNDNCFFFKSKFVMDISILRNGEVYSKLKAKECCIPLNKCGKYRIEISYKGKGYIYTNPFLVKGGEN